MEYAIIFVILYFIPGMIAYHRRKKNALAITLTNLFFGWTVIGWFGCLIWAVAKD